MGKQAENCIRFLDKGKKVCVCGRLDYNTSNDKKYYEIVANEVEFLSPIEKKPEVKLEPVNEEDLPF